MTETKKMSALEVQVALAYWIISRNLGLDKKPIKITEFTVDGIPAAQAFKEISLTYSTE